MEADKELYTAPVLRIVELQVEEGFATSFQSTSGPSDIDRIMFDENEQAHYGAVNFGSKHNGSDYGW